MRTNKKPSPPKNSTSLYNRLSILVIVVSFALIASMLWASSHAASAFVSGEPELGTITAPASSLSDVAASAGKAVKFTTTSPPGGVSSTTPCVGAAAPTQWKHVVVLMFENHTYDQVIDNTSAPYITSLAHQCGSYASWKDANYKVTGATDGNYISKPNYATLTNGVSPTAHNLTSDSYTTTTTVDNIYNRLKGMGKSSMDYYDGPASTTPCASAHFSGDYHVAMRYYTNLGGQSTDPTTYCNTHNKPISNFMTAVNAGTLPEFSMIYPTNDENMHNNGVPPGDAWVKTFLPAFLDSARYKSGDTALFFLWDEDSPIPNVLIAPSVKTNTHPVPSTLVFSHFSATRTWQEMLGITPLLGDTGQAPSLLNYYDGH